MWKAWLYLYLLIGPLLVRSQSTELPPDFRQHNLTEFNSSLMSPVFSLDRNNPHSLALWTRWQWQTIDGDPTTILFNYTRRFNRETTAGLGFFQHNTGVFIETGAVGNGAYSIDLAPRMWLDLGLNMFAYQRKLSDTRFQPNPDIDLPQFGIDDEFVLQIAPSLRFNYDRFSIGLVGENFIQYNFAKSENESADGNKISIGWLSYQFPITIFGDSKSSFLQPTVYLKSLPVLDNQLGFTTLFSTPKFWAQLGYNNFYGMSVGGGGRFFKNFSIGALMEFGSDSQITGSGSSFEILTAYTFGDGDLRRKLVGFEKGEEETQLAAAEATDTEASEREQQQAAEELARREQELLAAREQQRLDSLENARRATELALVEKEELSRRERRKRERDSIASAREQQAIAEANRIREQRTLDSIAAVRRQLALAEAQLQREQRLKDSLQQVKADSLEAVQKALALNEEVEARPGEKYEESVNEDGLSPGFYLIANVFGTKKYFDAFMASLQSKGLQPKSFFRSQNKFNYVYLEKYDTMEAARRARDSNFGGRYQENLWIFRVVVK